MADEVTRSDSRARLGRGLAALLGSPNQEISPLDQPHGARKLPIELVNPNAGNPRKNFSDDELNELAASIRQHGVLQPILVRKAPRNQNSYEIVAGERRWRAAQRAGLHEVPVIILEVSDREAIEIAIVENVQRSDLNALEEASGYATLIDQHGYTQADLGNILGKSRSHIANTLRLLSLPAHTKSLLTSGALSPGHARALLALPDADEVADQIVQKGLSVRDVERIASSEKAKDSTHRRAATQKDPDTKAWEDRLGLLLGARVTLRHSGESGEIRIAFSTLDQLDEFCRRLTAAPTDDPASP